MKIIINQSERGLLFRDGIFRRLLMPGRNKVNSFLGETYISLPIDKAIQLTAIDVEVLMEDSSFAESVTKIEVPDGYIGIRFEGDRLIGTLNSGKYFYFNCLKARCVLFDTSVPDITGLAEAHIGRLPGALYQKVLLSEGEVGLLTYDGKYIRTLTSGAHYFWLTTKTHLGVERIDMRLQPLEITGQEILTADKVSLRVNFVCNYRVTDAYKISYELKSYKERLYTFVQLVLREFIGKLRFDELLEKKDTLSDDIMARLQISAAEYYVEFSGAGIKDIVLPGEIRDIMNTVLVAEKKAQANVITRREEVASTRSLLNTARLLDENATLYRLKELEYLEKICDKVGSISVNGGNLLGELQKIVCPSKS